MQPLLNIDLRFTIDVPGGQCFEVFQYRSPLEPHIYLDESNGAADLVAQSFFSDLVHAAEGQAVTPILRKTSHDKVK